MIEPKPTPMEITDEQRKTFVSWVDYYSESRSRHFGKKYNKSDFFACAMVIFFATDNPQKIPPSWIFQFLR